MEASEASTAICRHIPSHFFLDVKGTFGPGVMTLSACCLLQHMLAYATSQATQLAKGAWVLIPGFHVESQCCGPVIPALRRWTQEFLVQSTQLAKGLESPCLVKKKKRLTKTVKNTQCWPLQSMHIHHTQVHIQTHKLVKPYPSTHTERERIKLSNFAPLFMLILLLYPWWKVRPYTVWNGF